MEQRRSCLRCADGDELAGSDGHLPSVDNNGAYASHDGIHILRSIVGVLMPYRLRTGWKFALVNPEGTNAKRLTDVLSYKPAAGCRPGLASIEVRWARLPSPARPACREPRRRELFRATDKPTPPTSGKNPFGQHRPPLRTKRRQPTLLACPHPVGHGVIGTPASSAASRQEPVKSYASRLHPSLLGISEQR
jgi:hypothetical protein